MDIKIEGIKVNNEKYAMYLLFEDKPSLSISFLIDFFISIKINTNNKKSKKIFKISNIVNYLGLIQQNFYR